MKIKNIVLLSLSSLLLLGCKSYFRYGVNKPYIKLDASNQETGILLETAPSKVIEKIEKEETFMLYIHAAHCSYCKASEEEFLNPYLEKNPVIVNGIDLDLYSVGSDERNIYFDQIKPYFGQSMLGTPYYALFQNGVFIKGEQDSSYFSLFFSTYIVS